MAKRRSSGIRVSSVGGWRISRLPTPSVRRAGETAADSLVTKLEGTGRVATVGAYQANFPPQRGIEDQPLLLDVEPPASGTYVVLARHASGAVTISGPEALPGRRRAGARRLTRRALRFRVITRSQGGTDGPPGRRSLLGKAVKVFILKILGKVLDDTIEKLAALWEERTWKKKDLLRGLIRVARDADGHLSLTPVKDGSELAGGRNLLFLHGTFSDFGSGFKALATTPAADGRNFFEAVADAYGDKIFAFNHFTVSKTPLENARQLLETLPAAGGHFDVITHSRGALVLRTLVEEGEELGPLARRFRLGNAVLIGAPNEGTPLASPERWETLTGWLCTLIDLLELLPLPIHPFCVGVEFIAEALSWIAQKAGGVIPGLAAMNPEGWLIERLQGPPLPSGRLSALVANFEPDSSWLARLADAGVDAFFQSANDLVVPSEGGWRVDADNTAVIPGDRIGCYGPGGNLKPTTDGAVHHCNFFSQPETVDFLVRGVLGEVQPLAALNPAHDLPSLFGRHRAAARARRGPAAEALATPVPAALPPPKASAQSVAAPPLPRDYKQPDAYALDEILNLFILVPEVAAEPWAETETSSSFNAEEFAQQIQRSTESQTALMIASFRNARVYESFKTTKGNAGRRWKNLIAMQRRIREYVDGNPHFESLPTDKELRDYGRLLFTTLLPGTVRRLYDSARAELRDRHLDICVTSMIGWVADMPWEFAFDPSRQMFLCMEEVNFLRNISTAVPADAVAPRGLPLRILVVAAQPIGAGGLSITQEKEVILRGFQELIKAGLAEVDVVQAATPELLHQTLTTADIEDRPYDVLHFIGHGEYESETGFGYLLFENAEGGSIELRADFFRQIVARRGIRLVFLNACETGMGMRGDRPFDFAQGVAPMLVAGGVPAVLANQFKVLDPSAVAFSRHFYWALANGRTVGDAAREARVAVNYSVAGEAIDWAVPVLFARNPGDRLTHSPCVAARIQVSEAARAVEGRRSRGGSPTERVAIWDVNYVLPELEAIVQRLNRAQAHFQFLAVDMPAPLGTWRRSQKDEDDNRVAFLDFDEVVPKLGAARKRFAVDHLSCITNLPLSIDGETYMIIGSVEDISVGSTYQFLPQLNSPGLNIQQLVVNYLAYCLSGLSAHLREPKHCVSYRNDERDIRWIAGPLKFCKRCQDRLPADSRRTALVALTAAFSGT